MGRKKKTPNIVLHCSKCGKMPPINMAMSNENWVVYNTKEDCECGGTWTHDIVSDEEFIKYEAKRDAILKGDIV